MALDLSSRIIDSRHPSWIFASTEWDKWRLCYAGGEQFRERYLKQFTTREDATDFALRKHVTPIPTYAKAAVNDIRNSIFQRMTDIIRVGGSETYRSAVLGQSGGVDLHGRTMDAFLGKNVLQDLLTMGRVGIFVDFPSIMPGATLADTLGTRPYCYAYQIEDILSWSLADRGQVSEFQSLLLQDTVLEYDAQTQLPILTRKRYRHLVINDQGFVTVQFYDDKGQPDSSPQVLELRKIPFVMLDIGESLIKDVADHQIALLNLVSSDVSYALLANHPFYTEQRDQRGIGHHLKPAANEDGTATAGGQGASDNAIKVGVTHGRAYANDTDRPGFIHPSPEPLLASMKLQEKLETDIRKLVNLAVATLSQRSSAESKQMDNQGLEAGLSYIGLVLEAGERQIAEYFEAYLGGTNVASVKYPERYQLETDRERIEKAEKLTDTMKVLPSRTLQRETAKQIATVLLRGKVSVSTLNTIYSEIDQAKYTTSNPDVLIQAKEAGLVGEQVASMALGFDENEYLQARKDHAARLAAIAAAQGIGSDQFGGETVTKAAAGAAGAAGPAGAPAARGVPDMAGDTKGGQQERAAANNTDTKGNTAPPVRGKGKAAA